MTPRQYLQGFKCNKCNVPFQSNLIVWDINPPCGLLKTTLFKPFSAHDLWRPPHLYMCVITLLGSYKFLLR